MHHDFTGPKGEDMRAVRRLRNFWILWVTTVVLACFSNAVAQASYRVTDLGTQGNDNMAMVMSVNDQGWTEIMVGNLPPGQQDSIFGTLLNGRALIDVDGFKLDLGTLGGPDSWMNWGEINDWGQVVGDSETAVPDPNGEDICGFGTHLTCLPFLWQFFHMSALPTLGGNNGQASGINNRGQIVGFAENGNADPTCPGPPYPRNRIQLPVLWKNGNAQAQALPTVDRDPDGDAFWINDQGQAVGDSGNCTGTIIHAVSWKNGNASALPDYGTGSIAQGINNGGQIVGTVGSADNTTQYGALWQNGVLTPLTLLPGDFGGIASGINDKGQVVGENFDSNFNWSHGFIYQNGVMTDLNTLFPASANLFALFAAKINERGQIGGMAMVISGPDKGALHAFLATPTNQRMGRSVADVVPTRPQSNAPVNVGEQHLSRFVLGHCHQ
jgi:probable HAF family extracellular repeat protein